ncbi:hypothetical protein STEG23_011841 [Scotinomys teguina]
MSAARRVPASPAVPAASPGSAECRKPKIGVWNAAQLVECLSSIHKVLGSSSSPAERSVMVHIAISALGREVEAGTSGSQAVDRDPSEAKCPSHRGYRISDIYIMVHSTSKITDEHFYQMLSLNAYELMHNGKFLSILSPLKNWHFREALKEISHLDLKDPESLDIAQFCFSMMWLTWVSQATDNDSCAECMKICESFKMSSLLLWCAIGALCPLFYLFEDWIQNP